MCKVNSVAYVKQMMSSHLSLIKATIDRHCTLLLFIRV
jgi:hypothetical protein